MGFGLSPSSSPLLHYLWAREKTIILVYSCTFFRDVNIEVSVLGFSRTKIIMFFFWSQSSAGQKISHCDKLWVSWEVTVKRTMCICVNTVCVYTVLYIYDHVYREILVLYKIYILCCYIEQKRICIKKVIYLRTDLSQLTVSVSETLHIRLIGDCLFSNMTFYTLGNYTDKSFFIYVCLGAFHLP